MADPSIEFAVQHVVAELERYPLPDLIYACGRITTYSLPDNEYRKHVQRKLAASGIAAHYLPAYREELIRHNQVRLDLGERCEQLQKALSELTPEFVVAHERFSRANDRAAIRYFAQFHFMAISSSMLRRLLLRVAAPFSCEGRLDSHNLDTLNCYEQLRDSMEHFDQRLPGGIHDDWMTREEIIEGRFVIVHRFKEAGNGRIELNGVEMEFSSDQVNRVVIALDSLVDQIRAAILRDVTRHMRKHPHDIPADPRPPRYFDHAVVAIE